MKITHLFVCAAVAAVASRAAAQEASVRVATPSVGYTYGETGHRAALGVTTGLSGTARDTLGLLVRDVTKGSPAEKAGIEEGNRLAAINGVNLRAAAADVEDNEMSDALVRRLTRELGKLKPGAEVDLRVYREGKFLNLKVKTADSDSLFSYANVYRTSEEARKDRENRPTLGIMTGSTGSRRDTLGVLVMGVADSSPALHAGIEEGNRIASINGVNLRVSREDAGDRALSSSKAQRLQREISQLKVGDNVTLSVYASGKFHDVTAKVARAADLPHSSGMFYVGDGFGGMTLRGTPMPSMPGMAPRIMRLDDMGPELRDNLDRARIKLDNIGPQIERSLREIEPRVRMQLENIGPQIRAITRSRWVDA
jgi:S1-C subfamily serine protease